MAFVLRIYIYYVLPEFRRLAIACVLLALLLSIFSKAFVIADFYANQDYIAKRLCINRLNTAIRCGGKCQLNRRLQQENKDKDAPEHKPDNRNETMSSRSFYLMGFSPYHFQTSRRYPRLAAANPIDQPSSHFHPPDRETPTRFL
ncbi:MAG TPA: hypothetical protein VL832_14890 [Puia sp.]|nr:hypothetical protein [Puia sp.]